MYNKNQEVQKFVNGVNEIVSKSQNNGYQSDNQVSLLGSSITSYSLPTITNTPQPGSYNSVINQMGQNYQSNNNYQANNYQPNNYTNQANTDITARVAQLKQNEAQNEENSVRQYVSSYTPDASVSNIEQAAQNLEMQNVQQSMQYSGQNQYTNTVEQNVKQQELKYVKQNMNNGQSY